MGLSQRRKGQAAEREAANLLTDLLGQSVQRILGQERDGAIRRLGSEEIFVTELSFT